MWFYRIFFFLFLFIHKHKSTRCFPPYLLTVCLTYSSERARQYFHRCHGKESLSLPQPSVTSLWVFWRVVVQLSPASPWPKMACCTRIPGSEKYEFNLWFQPEVRVLKCRLPKGWRFLLLSGSVSGARWLSLRIGGFLIASVSAVFTLPVSHFPLLSPPTWDASFRCFRLCYSPPASCAPVRGSSVLWKGAAWSLICIGGARQTSITCSSCVQILFIALLNIPVLCVDVCGWGVGVSWQQPSTSPWTKL